MDADRFDALARSLTVLGSRRRALAALSGALGLLGWHALEDTEAHNPLKKCKKKSGKAKKKCVKNAKAHNAEHAAQSPPPQSPPPPSGCTPRCATTTPCGSNGCGGSCGSCVPGDPICANGQCPANTCSPFAVFCDFNSPPCGGNCFCGSSRLDKAICADCAICGPGNCTTDNDCIQRGLPPGTVCGKPGVGGCDGCTTGVCLTPCGTYPVGGAICPGFS